ncbi:MAG: hypothetical protein WC654_00880 [Patescibacteria group bacterium]
MKTVVVFSLILILAAGSCAYAWTRFGVDYKRESVEAMRTSWKLAMMKHAHGGEPLSWGTFFYCQTKDGKWKWALSVGILAGQQASMDQAALAFDGCPGECENQPGYVTMRADAVRP